MKKGAAVSQFRILGSGLCILKIAILAALPVLADEIADSRALTQQALAAHKAKDEATFLAKIAAASDLRPAMPTLLYYRAAALAVNGRGDEAMDVLDRVAQMGMVYDVAKDEEFASLREVPRFRAIVETFAKNAAPIGSAKTAFTIPKKGIISEGLAYDPITRDFFVSSVRDGAIWRVHRGAAKPFVAGVGRGIFGMAVHGNVLWAATSPIEQNATFSASDRAAVIAVDLRSGRIVHTISAPDHAKHLFGDVAIGEDGTVYVSDSASPTIYFLDGDTMRPFLANGPFGSLQGIAPSRGVLYVADYSKGIAAVDLATRDVHFLSAPADATLLGIDGLYRAGPKTLIATQNGTNPQRVLRIDLDGLAVSRLTTLAANLPQMPDITLGTLAGSSFFFNGAALWDEKDATKWLPAVGLKVDVDR